MRNLGMGETLMSAVSLSKSVPSLQSFLKFCFVLYFLLFNVRFLMYLFMPKIVIVLYLSHSSFLLNVFI